MAAVLSLAPLLSGCAPLVVGGAVAGASALHDRRHYQVVIDDQQIELAAMRALLQDPSIRRHARISVTSYNHTLLLTGRARSYSAARRATEVVSRIPKVARVIDEISIGPEAGLNRASEDAYLTSLAKIELTKASGPSFDPTRIKVVTENGVVYLMGLVSPREADLAVERVRYVPGVKQVVKLFEYAVPNA